MTARRQRDRRATEAEVDLWRRAVSEATPLPGRARAAQPARAPVAGARPRPPMPPLEPLEMVSASRPKAALPLDRAALARLKKGRQPLEGRIDLHGMTAAVAQRNLAVFLRSSQAMGRRAVLVITGSGRDPDNQGRGVLKREAPLWLDSMPDIVAGYGAADRRHGGGGALYVRIRRKDKAGKS